MTKTKSINKKATSKTKKSNSRLEQWKKKNPAWYWVIKGSLIGLGSAFLLFWLLFFSVWIGLFGKVPGKTSLQNIKNYTASRVFSSDGEVIGKYFLENRTNVAYDEISPDIINALIATEDARFYNHDGLDGRSYARVFFKTIIGGNESSGGGSTITQQLAKNLFKRRNYSFLTIPVNKFREAIIAQRLEKVYTKEEILTLYLNTVPFGGNIYGIETATINFFNKGPKKVKIEEAAVIIGMLKANTAYNPVNNPEAALRRRNTVLNQMVKYEYLEASKADSLKQLPIKLQYRKDSHNEGLATYFREQLRVELDKMLENYKKADGTSYNLYTDGLRIYTTIDSRMQKYAEEAVNEHMATLQKSFNNQVKRSGLPKGVVANAMKKSNRYLAMKDEGYSEAEITKAFGEKHQMKIWDWQGERVEELTPLDSIKHYQSLLNAGFLAMEPSTGHIKAWVGGINHKYYKYSHITAKRQVGSTFKPIVYAAALENGVEPCEYIPNELVTYTDYKDWTPQNADGNYGGFYSMEGGLTNSVNTISVNLIMQTGVNEVIRLARAMGISGNIPKVPSIALGAADISLMDMVKAYCVFPNRGTTIEPVYLVRIEDADGKIIADFKKPKKSSRAISTETADIMNHILQGVVNNGTGARLRSTYGLQGPIAGKTGTTQEQADGWFIGYTPNLVAGAWVGADDRRVRFSSLSLGQGANTGLPIWGKFMTKVNRDAKLRKVRGGGFAGLDSTMAEKLNCAPFVFEEPRDSIWDIFFGDGDNEERKERERVYRERRRQQEEETIFDKLKDIFKNN